MELVLAIAVTILAASLIVVLRRQPAMPEPTRTEFAELRVALEQRQADHVDRMFRQLTTTVTEFHTRLGAFGDLVKAGQADAGKALATELDQTRRTLQEQLHGLIGQVNTQLAKSHELLGTQVEGATTAFGGIKEQLGQVAEMARHIEGLGRELDELQDVLKTPKLRGELGEATLEEFLRQVLTPAFFHMQHRFSDGQVVDAVITLREHLVPIDAKFPLDAFRRLRAAQEGDRPRARREFERAIKGHIDAIAEKYIRPAERTFEFALMFIPAENVYYEVISQDEGSNAEPLLAYASQKRVIPVSPNSIYAYLHTIATGLKGMQVEARAREIIGELTGLRREFSSFQKDFRVLGTHLGRARDKFEDTHRLADRFADRLANTTRQQLDDGPSRDGDASPPPHQAAALGNGSGNGSHV